jgi:hypothetical protein
MELPIGDGSQNRRGGRTGLGCATTSRRIVAADWLQIQRGVITDTSYDCNVGARALIWARVPRTKRELAAALLFDFAEPDPSNAPATTLMLNKN